MGPPVSGIAMETHHVFVYKGLLDMSVKEVNKLFTKNIFANLTFYCIVVDVIYG